MVLMEYLGLAPSSTLVLAFLTLFAAALIVYGIGHLAGKYTGWIAALALLISTLLMLDIVMPASTTGVLAGPYTWIPAF